MAEEQKANNAALGQEVVQLLARSSAFSNLSRTLADGGRAGAVGLWGSSAPAVAAAILPACPSTLLFVTAHIDSADDVCDDLELFAGSRPVAFPAWESVPGGKSDANASPEGDLSDEILAGRLKVLKALSAAAASEGETHQAKVKPPRMIVAPIQAIMQPVPSPRHLEENTLHLTVGQKYPPAELRRWLAHHGFQTAELVAEPGQYASRGGIIDVYPPAGAACRLEFFGDEIESIRIFDVATQRSIDERRETAISACLPSGTDAWVGSSQTPPASMCLLDYLPQDALVVWHEPLEIAEMGRSFITRFVSPVGICTFSSIVQQTQAFTMLDVSSFASAESGDAVRFATEALPPFTGKAEVARDEIAEMASDNRVIIFCDNEAEQERLGQILQEITAGS
ncbi:MAG: hypothetical protein QF662_07140, partial [Phycisphaerae bacterium]|nr:hypothetical protein [Phycisphaerae bacterium]